MHWKLFALAILIPGYSLAQSSYTQFVNPFIGTGGHGHTFPGATMPFGMVQLSPDTRIDNSWDGCSGYHYSDSIIYGFSHTHLSGTGVSDYGDILIMPTLGDPVLNPVKNGGYKNGYASHFSHKRETASPGYYSVHLDDDNIDVELTVVQRVGMHKYVFPKTSQANIILDLTHRDRTIESSIRYIDSRHIEGMRRSTGWAANQVIYFAIEFSKQFDSYGIAVDDSIRKNIPDASGVNLKSFFQFSASAGEAIYVKVAISSVSTDAAWKNMEAECREWDFEEVRLNAEATWNYELSKIRVSGGTEEQKKIFYTALYHCMIAPNIYSDADKNYRGADFQVHHADYFNEYTVFSLWDTFRGLHPLLTIIDQKRTVDFVKSFLSIYQQSGRLPVWSLAGNETDCMIGYHSVSVMADAALKGIKGFDYNQALYAAEHAAGEDIFGLKAYKDKGYIGADDEGESVSKTLEYAYDDWCIAQLAKRINDTVAYKEFIGRAQNWKNIFDPLTGFMRPKKNGNFISPFDPYQVNFNYTEANAWQYLFFVPHDIDGLISMMGGSQQFEAKLDTLFSTSSKTTGREQSDISGMIGQYAHGNEPSHHMAYLYDYIGKPWKTQELVHEIINKFYHNEADGLIGNEDCGQMSAWYVLSAMGFYSVTPGSPYYAIGSPVFDTVTIHLENQKKFKIIAHHPSADAIYIQSIKVNGQPTDTMYFSQSMITQGKEVEFVMGKSPTEKTKFISSPPSSILTSLISIDPLIEAGSASFHESLKIILKSPEPHCKLFYTLNGQAPSRQSTLYVKPFSIYENTAVKVISINSKGVTSKIVTAKFTKTNKDWKVQYVKNYNPQYDGGGDSGLMDEQSGSNNFKNGMWQGWWGDDMEVIVDLGKDKSISQVAAEFLQDQHSWILMPQRVEYEISTDGKNFLPLGTVTNNISDNEEQAILKNFSMTVKSTLGRYVKIKAINYGTLPSWHPGSGGKAWIFCDEIFIE